VFSIVALVALGTLEPVASLLCTLELAKRGTLEVVGALVGASVVGTVLLLTAASFCFIVTVSNDSTSLALPCNLPTLSSICQPELTWDW
jgi:hypothetical protein